MKYALFLLSVILITTIILMLPAADLLAQPGLPGSPSQAPIDGGLSLLAAGGAAYAVKKLRERKTTS